MAEETRKRTIYVQRCEDDEAPKLEKFEVDCYPGITLLGVLNEIKWRLDGSLSYRRSCGAAICGSCAVNVNGKNYLACNTQADAVASTGSLVFRPVPGFKVLKDLVTDFDPFFEKAERMKPYLIRDEEKIPKGLEEIAQTPEEMEVVYKASECIFCGACSTSCPATWTSSEYIGPNAFVLAFRYMFDSRDEGYDHRAAAVAGQQGLWRCHDAFNCVEACPKDIQITDMIAAIKREILDR